MTVEQFDVEAWRRRHAEEIEEAAVLYDYADEPPGLMSFDESTRPPMNPGIYYWEQAKEWLGVEEEHDTDPHTLAEIHVLAWEIRTTRKANG